MAGQNGTDGLTGTVSAQKVAETHLAPDVNTPVKSLNRIGSLDFIRGLAVMGILAANIVAFGQPFAAYMYPEAFLVPHGDNSGWMWITQFLVIDGKMRGLFTLLFGAGMYLFVENSRVRGATRWLQARRLGWLLMFGLAHFFFIWKGDILAGYAMCGLIALLFVNLTAKNQLILGLIGYFFGTLLLTAMIGSMTLAADTDFGDSPEFAEFSSSLDEGKAMDLADNATETAMISGGHYADWVSHNFSEHAAQPFVSVMMFGWETLPLMLIGMALFRMGLFDGRLDPARQRLWGWLGLIIGGAMTLGIALWARSNGFTYYGTLAAFIPLTMIPRLLMALGMAALLSLWAPSVTGWLGQRVSAAGRAAFTNYLGTSIVMMFVFHGWAGGRFGEFNRPQLYLVVLATWVVMLLWSKPWLDRFRYGPLEWLWRCLTYGKLFPMRR